MSSNSRVIRIVTIVGSFEETNLGMKVVINWITETAAAEVKRE